MTIASVARAVAAEVRAAGYVCGLDYVLRPADVATLARALHREPTAAELRALESAVRITIDTSRAT